jgi:F-type H+-transporting ATPase subunit b
MKALDERTSKIAEGLAAAERGQQEQELGQQRALEVMKEAKTNASDIVGQAQKRYNEILDEAKRDAQAEAERIKTAAHAEIEQETNRAREELRERMATLAIAAAEKILQKEIDADAHKASSTRSPNRSKASTWPETAQPSRALCRGRVRGRQEHKALDAWSDALGTLAMIVEDPQIASQSATRTRPRRRSATCSSASSAKA